MLRLIIMTLALGFTLLPMQGGATPPVGIFSASGALNSAVTGHPQVQGVLVRAMWSDLEPAPGVFQWTPISNQVQGLQAAGLDWSLAISGSHFPAWLTEVMGAESFTILFHGQPREVPKAWDPIVQTRLGVLAGALAAEFGDDPSLRLVYVPQMTANGIEGHFNGVPEATLVAAGYTEEIWIDAVSGTARQFAAAFPSQNLAVEVHEILDRTEPAMGILTGLWQDPELDQRVGGAVWWLSGRTDYQADLLAELAEFPGTLYAQLIASSAEPERFQDGDLNTALDQARDLGIRYVEAWEYEFVHATHDADFATFNAEVLPSASPSVAPPLLLLRGHPNPFNAHTELSFRLPWPGVVRLDIHDLRGRRLATVWNGPLAAGEHRLAWDGRTDAGRVLPSGSYTAVMRTDEGHTTRPLMLVK